MSQTVHSLRRFLNRGSFAELYLEDTASLSLLWEDNRLESSSRAFSSGAGLRYLHNGETRFGHITLPAPFAAAPSEPDAARFGTLASELGEGWPIFTLGSVPVKIEKHHPLSIPFESLSVHEKVELLKRISDEARKAGPFVRQVSVQYGERFKRIAVFNSEGRWIEETRPYAVVGITVIAEKEKLQQTAYEAVGGLGGLEKVRPFAEELARMVGRRAVAKLSAPPAPVGPMPVVLSSSAGGTLIHEAIGHSLEADAVLDETSPSYRGKVGKTVGVPFLNVVDDPTISGARGSFYFDDEGTSSERTLLVENGVLKTYLYDRLSAGRAGVVSNGHGRRESFEHKPIPRMSNTCVLPGTDDPQKIVSDFRDGFLVTKMGGGQVNTANGDFVFEVEEGFHIQNGKAVLVRGATLLGNGPDALFSIEHIGSDWGWGLGTCGKEGQGVPVGDAIPTMKIKSLVIGGGL
jgi:TldD protein